MFRVKYWSAIKGFDFRNYKNYSEKQVRAIADNYSRRHGLVWIAIEKVY